MKRAISTISWPYSSYASASTRRPAPELADRPAVVVDPPQVVATARRRPVALEQRRERAVERQDVEAVLRQLEIADDLGPQQAHDVARRPRIGSPGRSPRSRRRHRGLALLEDEGLQAGARQIGRADEAVVAATDDDRVVATGPRNASLRAYPDCIGLMQV